MNLFAPLHNFLFEQCFLVIMCLEFKRVFVPKTGQAFELRETLDFSIVLGAIERCTIPSAF